jgi:hypothetical protein
MEKQEGFSEEHSGRRFCLEEKKNADSIGKLQFAW